MRLDSLLRTCFLNVPLHRLPPIVVPIWFYLQTFGKVIDGPFCHSQRLHIPKRIRVKTNVDSLGILDYSGVENGGWTLGTIFIL